MLNRKNSILLIDDERDNISSLKEILGHDYVIYASTNGKDAIETAEEFIPDVILLDVLMPEMDGYDIITALKNSFKTRDIPVIFITGLDNIDAEIKGLSLGAADYISKPFHPAIINLRIKNQIQLIERLRQESFITNIIHNFLVKSNTGTLYNDTLLMAGEFMSIASILLYKFDKNDNSFICHEEWINAESDLQTRIGDKIDLNEEIISEINNMLLSDEKHPAFISSDLFFKDKIKLQRQHIQDYIVTPIFIKGKINAFLVFFRNNSDEKWSKSEKDIAVLIAGIFSAVFERDAIQHAEYLSRAKSEFLSRMNHEMRTPMNAILGILQIMDFSNISDETKKHCNIMKASAESLLCMIEEVLDISDLEYGAFTQTDSVFDFKAAVWDLLKIADKNACKKHQLLDCRVDPAIPNSLYGDEKRIKHVVNTLLANAVKFTPESGEIFFDTHVTNEDNGMVTLKVEVTDNGIGMSREQQINLFSIFEQADNSLCREYGGIGLGLALSKRIIELMDGSIGVESELGKGSRFWFTCKMRKGA